MKWWWSQHALPRSAILTRRSGHSSCTGFWRHGLVRQCLSINPGLSTKILWWPLLLLLVVMVMLLLMESSMSRLALSPAPPPCLMLALLLLARSLGSGSGAELRQPAASCNQPIREQISAGPMADLDIVLVSEHGLGRHAAGRVRVRRHQHVLCTQLVTLLRRHEVTHHATAALSKTPPGLMSVWMMPHLRWR